MPNIKDNTVNNTIVGTAEKLFYEVNGRHKTYSPIFLLASITRWGKVG